ncbi:uncharacterized protein LOC111333126 [Stylophora pistillata]|uniref:uncharacterized protein LOC111333126 n=1 Tax=Stylophora pistillata TaxID=50429 RepID=UPI000C04C0C7|nr:uncharacterized protein LOC111333126 [Stylophora pistillata]
MALASVRFTVIVLLSSTKPKKSIFCWGWSTDFTGWIVKPRKTLKSTIRGKMAFVTKQTSSIVHVAINLISFLVICTRADVTSECANVATCIGTYADIYNSLASDESSFNIESALYPANEPSSVLVFVNLCGQNGSDKACDNSTPGVKKYTWSLRSLYAAFPPLFLEISSLFSILVTPRTKHLNITIPPFCCNVSEEDREKMIKNVLASLQDLAVLPGLRDPRLNFAESVIEGHILDMKASGRSYTRVVLWFSLLCPLMFGPFLYFWVLQCMKDDTQSKSLLDSDENRCRIDYICCKKEKPLIRSVTVFCSFLLLIEVIFVLVCERTSIEISKRGNMSRDFIVLVVFIPEWLIICSSNCLCFKDLDISSFCSRLMLIVCTSLVSYHLSWVAIGIMINPAWGVSILLGFSFFFITLFFVISEIAHASYSCLSTFSAFTPGFLGLCFIFVPPVLVGQSFYGRETADDILKTAFLSVIGAVSWLSFKSRKVSSNSSQCIEAANKAADAAKELAAKITELQPDGTGIHSAIVAATTAACNSASAAAAAATAVAAALAETGRNENTTPNGNELGEEGLPLRSNRRPSPQ